MEIWGQQRSEESSACGDAKNYPLIATLWEQEVAAAHINLASKDDISFRKCRPLLLARFICAQEFLHLRRISHQLVAGFTIGLTVE